MLQKQTSGHWADNFDLDFGDANKKGKSSKGGSKLLQHDFSSESDYSDISDLENSPKKSGSNQQNQPRRIVKYCYENQRFWLTIGWNDHLGGALERAPWSDSKGHFSCPKNQIVLENGWRWETPWQIEGKDVPAILTTDNRKELDHNNTYDSEGWQYAN